MKILSVLKRGAVKSALAYKFLIVMWLVMLVTVFLVAIPLRAEFKSAFGTSMLKDSLLGGFDLGVLGDIAPVLKPIMAGMPSGILMLLLVNVLLYSFFAGGLFTRFTTEYGNFRVHEYFKSSARYFFPFLGVFFIVFGMTILWSFLSILLPIAILKPQETGMEALVNTIKILAVVWFLGIPVLLLVADHARRWMTTTGTRRVFTAIGAGFQSTFKSFLMSYFAVLIVLLVSVVLSYLTLRFVSGSLPEKGIFIFLFFIVTQALVIIKLWAKAWRYATVTEMAFHQ